MSLSSILRDLFAPAPRPDPVPVAIPAELTMYGADWCGDCRQARRILDAAGVDYRWVDLTQDPVAKAMLKAAGLPAIPVVATTDGRILMEPSNGELAELVASLA